MNLERERLRRAMAGQRARLPLLEQKRAAREAFRQLLTLHAFLAAPRLFCYQPFRGELPMGPVLSYAHANAKPVAFPKVLPDGKMAFFFGGALRRGAFDIWEPEGGAEARPSGEDWMLLPGLAFSKDGGRLGYGKGYYDRYLAGLRTRPVLCGFGYDFQMLETLPREAHDWPLTLLVSPGGVVWIKSVNE